MGKKKKTEVLSDTFTETSFNPPAKTILTMDNGMVYEVVSEDGKYFRCRNTQFRKANPHILRVERARDNG